MNNIKVYINALQKTLGNKTGSTNPAARSMSSGASSRTPARTIQARNNQQIQSSAQLVARPSAQLVAQSHSSSEATLGSAEQNSSRRLAEYRSIKLRSPEKPQEVSDRDLLDLISGLKSKENDNFKRVDSDSESDEESDRAQGAASSGANNDRMPVGLFGVLSPVRLQPMPNNGSDQSHTSTSTMPITPDRKGAALNGVNDSDTEHESTDEESDHDLSSSESSSDDNDNKESDRSQNTRPKRLFSNQTRTREGDLFESFPSSSESSSDDDEHKSTDEESDHDLSNNSADVSSSEASSDDNDEDYVPSKEDYISSEDYSSSEEEDLSIDIHDPLNHYGDQVPVAKSQNARLKRLRAYRSHTQNPHLKKLHETRIARLRRLFSSQTRIRNKGDLFKSFLSAPEANANDNKEVNHDQGAASSEANNKIPGLFEVSQPMPNAESPKSSPRNGLSLFSRNLSDEFNKAASTSNPSADKQPSSTSPEGQPLKNVKREIDGDNDDDDDNDTPPSQQINKNTQSPQIDNNALSPHQDRFHGLLNPTAAASVTFSSIDEVMGLFQGEYEVVKVVNDVTSAASNFIGSLQPFDQATFYLVFRTKDKHVFYIKATKKPNKTLSKAKIRTFNKGDIQIGGKDKLIFMRNLGPSLTVFGLWKAATEGLGIEISFPQDNIEMAKTNVAAADSKTPHKTPKRK